MVPEEPTTAPAPCVVLDTNVLLDWRVFRDPLATPLARAVECGQLQWVACEAMRDEWGHVWPRSAFARWAPDPVHAGSVFGHARMVDPPARSGLRCKDPDDQVFIDLAVAQRARWLITKDRALLQLARRALALHGVGVMTLAQWHAGQTAEPAPGVA